jgi:hypothetical protein
VLKLAYPSPSEVETSPTESRIALALDAGRARVGLSGRVRDPELFRDALLTACAVRQSDLRYKGKDRAAYLAHLMKQGKKATAAVWEAQKAFLESAYADSTPRPRGLDPVLTVDPDEVSLEVFSRDEGAYARLALSNDLFDDRSALHGSTLADISDAFAEQVERIRTYQPLRVEASTTLAKKAELRHARPRGATGDGDGREIDLPDEWLRGFLQVQSAATLPSLGAELAPIDLYNVLFTLRTRKAKKAPRGLRFELVPGMRPRLLIEPWEIALECHGEVYRGAVPRIVRVFGRQRLFVLARALPHLRKVRVYLTGPGLPSFWVLDMGRARLTVSLTSWAESKWASVISFDALTPRAEGSAAAARAVDELRRRGPLGLGDLAKATGQSNEQTRATMQLAALSGQALYDIAVGAYRPRSLLPAPVDPGRIRYGSPREAAAHRLLGDGAAPTADVAVTKLHTIAGEGQEISGEVKDRQARRGFLPRFTVDLEGQVRDAWCNCPTYQRSGVREGPCEHMIALYVFYKREAEKAERLRTTADGRKLVRAETRTLVRRDAVGAQQRIRLSLDARSVRVERRQAAAGQPLGEERIQRTWFDTDAEAREAYFARLDDLTEKGFIDTDAMTA